MQVDVVNQTATVPTEMIVQLFIESRKTYGTRRLRSCLYKLGHQVSRRRIGRIMHQAGLICKTKKKFKE